MSLGEKLQTVADNLKHVYGKGTAVGFGDGYQQGFSSGMTEGVIQEKGKCFAKHFVDSVMGNDSNVLRISMPFAPDVVMVYSIHPFTIDMPNTYRGFCADLRACTTTMGSGFYCHKDGSVRTALISSDGGGRFFSYDNGIFQFHIDGSSMEDVLWRSNVRYHIVAGKYPEESAQSLVREQIANLPAGSTGTVNYSQKRIYEVFTTDEWNTLTASKPNWEFVLK